jgi:ketosteroid isomerase-like protein
MIKGSRVLLLCVAAAGSLLAGCTRPGSADTAAIAEQVRKDATELVADYNAQNAAAAAVWDAPDYVGVFHGTPNVNGPAADEAGMKAAMAATKVLWQIGEPKVTVSKAGDLGIFEVPYTFTMTTPQGASSKESGTWIAIFKRQDDGKMKLWRSIGSDAPLAKGATS